MKLNLIVLATLCCAAAVPAPVCAAPAPAQTAQQKAEADKKAAAEAKAKAEAEKKAKQEAERKAKAEAQANASQANALAQAFAQAVKFGKFDEAEAKAKDAFALFGKPGVQGPDWFARQFCSYDFNRAKGETRARAIKAFAASHRLLVAKSEGDAKVARMNALADVLKLDKQANAKEIAQVLADRYKVPGTTKKTTIMLCVGDCDFAAADKAAEALLKEAPAGDAAALAKAFDELLAAYGSAGIFSCEAARKWWDRAAKEVVLAGDAKWNFLNRHAAFLEQYALAPMEEVDKIRAERDQVADLSPKLRFQNALEKMQSGDTDEGYAKALAGALAAAGTNAQMRLQVYDRALGTGWNAPGAIPSGRPAFIRDVVLKDAAAIQVKGRLSQYLAAYANAAYRDFEETEKFIKSYDAVDHRAVRSALRALWTVAGKRYYHGLDPVFAKKIMATWQQELAECEAAKPLKPDWNYPRNLENLRRKVVYAAIEADEPAVAEAQLAALEKDGKSDRAFIACRRGQIAFKAKKYAEAVKLLQPIADDKAFDNRWDLQFPAEELVRSFVALGDVENAAKCMEKKINCFPRWTQRNYYKPRLEALKARAEEAKKAREAAEAK